MYVDGFIIPLPKDRIDDYRRIAEVARDVWLEYGATGYVEALADDVPYGEQTSFPRAVQQTEEETVVFSWITYPSREVRDSCMEKVMADERIKCHMDNMPFDGKRMIWGGFTAFVVA